MEEWLQNTKNWNIKNSYSNNIIYWARSYYLNVTNQFLQESCEFAAVD